MKHLKTFENNFLRHNNVLTAIANKITELYNHYDYPLTYKKIDDDNGCVVDCEMYSNTFFKIEHYKGDEFFSIMKFSDYDLIGEISYIENFIKTIFQKYDQNGLIEYGDMWALNTIDFIYVYDILDDLNSEDFEIFMNANKYNL